MVDPMRGDTVMRIGVMIHATDHTIEPARLAVEAEMRGFASRKNSWPASVRSCCRRTNKRVRGSRR
jgi:hypothetical protein